MKHSRRRLLPGLLALVWLMCAGWAAQSVAVPLASAPAENAGNPKNRLCLGCHTTRTPVIVQQWKTSRHAQVGTGCLECHAAAETDTDAFMHNGNLIATIVTPNDCAACHREIVEEFQASHHAKAGDILGSLDNVLGEVVEGLPAAANGCQQCHGTAVKFLTSDTGAIRRDAAGKPLFDPATWPNTGMGRINLDGSRGSCSACHSRHTFSRNMARSPEVCGKCHMGPDHPQAEIYAESKHGIAFNSQRDQMNLSADPWVVGVDYSAAPTCATCHMSATRTQPVTHDVGRRISWTLRPVISIPLENAAARRDRMKDVCSACHTPAFVGSFYTQYDAAVGLYNDKFARPAQEIMNALTAAGRITPTQFDDRIEWIYYELWHHEGRRARMGASMMGPDYTQWHGFYEVAKTFYTEFLPEAEALAKGTAAEAVVAGIKARDENKWLQGLSPEAREQIRQFYRQRYGEH